MAFHYNVIPKPSGGFSTRISYQPDLPEAQLVADVAAETGLTVEQVSKVSAALLRHIIVAGKDAQPVRNLFGLVTFLPRSGGSFANIDFQPSFDALNVGINGNLTPDGLALMADGITFERDGVDGVKTPSVERVYDATSRARNKCTPGGGFKIGGEDFFHFDEVPANVGVYLQPVAGGARVRVTSYISWKDSEISGVWPTGLTGTQTLIVETTYEGGGIRSTTYTTPLPV